MKNRNFWILAVILVLIVGLVSSCSGNTADNILPTGKWKVLYEYDDDSVMGLIGIAESARAVAEGSEKVIGEARLEDLTTGKDEVLKFVVVKETHYNSHGKEIFTCKSFFDISGEKIKVTEIKGERIVDLFKSWPMSTSPMGPSTGPSMF